MTDDTRTRLQEAITTAREAIWDVGKRPGVMTVPEAVDRYGELVAMEARMDGYDLGWRDLNDCTTDRWIELDAEAARLLAVDGPTEAQRPKR